MNTSVIAVKRRASAAQVLMTALLAVIGLIASVPTAPTAHAAVSTVVSLTFDDGVADQASLPSLLPTGMRVTMFVNSGRVGMGGYLTWTQISNLQTGGYEIGGHTVSHADLPTLSTDEQKRQVCDDRSALLGHGLHVTDFAYPYGDDNATTQQIVHDCGYNSARTVGGLVSASSCGACPYTDTVPPANAYEVATPDSIKSDTTLAQLQQLVTDAESHGGGWLPLVFHHLCTGSSCPVYSVDPTVLHDFAAWLAGRSGSGTTVQTVAQVVGGAQAPPVAGPPPATPTGGELLRNPSLETLSSGSFPDCWQQGSTAVSNTATFTRTNDAHTGSFAERIDVTAYTSGDRKLVSSQDLGQCAPAVTPGRHYVVSAWYKSNIGPRLMAFYLDAANQWHYMTQSPALAASASWAHAQLTIAAPSNAKAMSVGMAIAAVGSVTMDDFSFIDADSTPPAVTLTSPSDGYPVKGQQLISASASDTSGIRKVEFLIDGVVVGSATSSPYKNMRNSSTHPDGTVAIAARATDGAGNVATSPSINVMVSNNAPNTGDKTAPAVSLKSLPLAVTAAKVRLTWTGSDAASGVASYDVRYRRASYNGGFGSWTAPSSWQATTATTAVLGLAKGYDYCAQVRARDRAGNVSGWSAARCVTRALDDRALAKTAKWTRKTGKGFYLGTFTVTTRAKAVLTRTGARVDRVGILATKCRGCGTVAVYVGKKLIGKISLAASTTHKQRLILLPRFAYRTGTITIKVLTSRKTVQIDGLIACRT